jgi:hypothetical protein
MHKIADADELETELRRLLAYTQTEEPSRSHLASELHGLSLRVAEEGSKRTYGKQVNAITDAISALRRDLEKAVEEGGEGRGDTIEAHGVKGMGNKPWTKTFKDSDALQVWVEKNSADVYGTRDLATGHDTRAEKQASRMLTKLQRELESAPWLNAIRF